MKLPALHTPWLIVAAVVLIGASFASLLFMAHQTYRLNQLLQQSYWAAAQVESEYLRLRNSTELYIARAPNATHERMRLNLDILFARIDVITKGNTDQVAGGHKQTAAFAADLLAMAEKLDVLTADPAFRNGPEAIEVLDLLRDEWLPLHEWVRDILHGTLWRQDRSAISDRQDAIIVANAVLAILSLAVVFGIFLQNHRSRSLAAREAAARAKAETAAASRDRFVAGMSHELRTPLNAIIGFCDLLSLGIHGRLSDRQSEYVSHIGTSGRHLLSLINDILDYSKLEARMHEPEFTKVDLCKVVEDAVRFIEPTFVAGGGEVELRLPESPMSVYSDRRLTLQCVVNLLSNSAKFSPANGRIVIDLIRRQDKTILTIRDFGPGMTEQEIESAFQPFKQYRDPYTASSGGTGLGLTLTRSFCTMLGAELSLRPAEGRGLEAVIEFQTKTGAGPIRQPEFTSKLQAA